MTHKCPKSEPSQPQQQQQQQSHILHSKSLSKKKTWLQLHQLNELLQKVSSSVPPAPLRRTGRIRGVTHGSSQHDEEVRAAPMGRTVPVQLRPEPS